MADFNIRSDSVNVEQIMEQIRARIREKRGVDYTEQQIRELASVKLETFLNPHLVRSGLLEQFREGGTSPFENYEFEDSTLFESHRAPLVWLRRLLRPFLKLFFNINRLIAVLNVQSKLNTKQAQFSQVSFELLHNLVVETTRLGIEVKNLKMRVESLSSRHDFAERRARALEGIVQARLEERGEEPPSRGRGQQQAAAGRGPQAQPPQGRGTLAQATANPPQSETAEVPGTPGIPSPGREGGESVGDARRRRRRRRGRRGGAIRPGTEETLGEANGQEDGGRQEPAAADAARDESSGGPADDPGPGAASLPFSDREDQ